MYSMSKASLPLAGALIGIGALINKNTFEGWFLFERGTYRKEGANQIIMVFGKLKDMYSMFFSIQIDKQLASGEYFLQEKERRLKAQQERKVCTCMQSKTNN